MLKLDFVVEVVAKEKVNEDENEIQWTLQQNRGKVKGWLFSGPVPYIIAEKYLKAK